MIWPPPLNLHRSISIFRLPLTTLTSTMSRQLFVAHHSSSWVYTSFPGTSTGSIPPKPVVLGRWSWGRSFSGTCGSDGCASAAGTQTLDITDYQVWEGPSRSLAHLLGTFDWGVGAEWRSLHLHRRFTATTHFWAGHLDSWSSTLGGIGYRGLQDWCPQNLCPYRHEAASYFLECPGELGPGVGLLDRWRGFQQPRGTRESIGPGFWVCWHCTSGADRVGVFPICDRREGQLERAIFL